MSLTARPARRSMRPRRAAMLGAVVFGVAMLLPGLMAGPAGASTDGCRTPSAGSIRVVIVVDPGDSAPVVTCMVVPDGITGSRLLAQRAAELGAPSPSYAGSGLLCTIDGYPASGCAETSSGSYWANFSGTSGSWVYSSYNPFIRHLHDGDIEGWRHVVHGSGAAGDAAPSVAPGAALFPAIESVVPQTPTPGATTGGSDASPSAVVAADASTDPPASPESATAGSAGAGSDSATDAVAPRAASGLSSAGPASAGSAASTSSSRAPWLAPVAAIAIIVLVAAGAVVRSRRRA